MLYIGVAVVDGPTEDLYWLGGDAHILAVGLHTRQGDIVPLVEPAVTYACTDDEANDHPHEEFVGPICWAVLVFVEFNLDEVAQIYAYRPQQTIPADASLAEVSRSFNPTNARLARF